MTHMTSSTPDVSVVIAAYQASDFIGAAIQAAMTQKDVSVEIIIVDDCSPHPQEAAVRTAANDDPRVRFIRLEDNQGPAGARNAAFDLARGEYIAILDADDDMKPDRLRSLLSLAREHEADLVVDNMIEYHLQENIRQESPFLDLAGLHDPLQIDLEAYMGSGILPRFNQSLGYLKPLFRRDFIEAGHYRYDSKLINSEDYYLVAQMLADGAKMMLTHYAGYYYFRHEASLSFRLSPAQAHAIADAEEAFLRRNHKQLSQAEKQTSLLRQRVLKKTAASEEIISALKAKAPIRALKLILSSPLSAPSHLWRLLRIGLRKLF